MLNKEKYAEDIIELAVNSKEIAVDKETMKPSNCSNILCDNCLFKGVGCGEGLIQWANSEYHEPKHFTEDEKELVRLLVGIKWLSKDKNGVVVAYTDKPEKDDIYPNWTGNAVMVVSECTNLSFDSIKWEDEEPTSREEILGE